MWHQLFFFLTVRWNCCLPMKQDHIKERFILQDCLYFFLAFSNTQSMTYRNRKQPLAGSGWGEIHRVWSDCCLVALPVWRCYWLPSSSRHGDPEMSSDPVFKHRRPSKIFTCGLFITQIKHFRSQLSTFQLRRAFRYNEIKESEQNAGSCSQTANSGGT